MVKKSEVGGQKSEEEKKSEVGGQKSDEESPKSEEENKSAPDSYRDVNRKPEMEVHHHPEVEKKGFKQYLLEGLMIFLAVFMGFIAENIRETIVEKKREKEYIKEMVNNLKYDTTRCNKNIAADNGHSLGLDSLRDELKKAIEGKADGNKLYYFTLVYSGVISRAVFNTSAYTELKSSGSLRLIGDKKLVSEMSDYYDRRVTAALNAQPTELSAILTKTNDEFFSWMYFDDLIKANDNKNTSFKTVYNYQKILSMQPALKLLDTKPADLQRLYNEVADFELGLKNYIFYLKWVKEGSIALMGSIEKQYNLDDD